VFHVDKGVDKGIDKLLWLQHDAMSLGQGVDLSV
jgi:hypothetical protein